MRKIEFWPLFRAPPAIPLKYFIVKNKKFTTMPCHLEQKNEVAKAGAESKRSLHDESGRLVAWPTDKIQFVDSLFESSITRQSSP